MTFAEHQGSILKLGTNMTESMEAHFKEHIEQVTQWLDEHVRVYEEPETVTVTNLTFDKLKRKGTFSVYLSDCKLDEEIGFRFEVAKKPMLSFPMYYSPMGAPASYAQYNLTYATKLAIIKAVYRAYQAMLEISEQDVFDQSFSEPIKHSESK